MGSEYTNCIPYIVGITLNCIWWWGSSSGNHDNLVYFFIGITPESTLTGVVISVKVAYMGQIYQDKPQG